MSTEVMQYFVGPVAGLVIALAVIYSLLYTRKLAPGYVADAAEERAEKVDAENERLNATVLELSKLNAGMEERVKSLEERIGRLTGEIEKLRKRLGDD